MTRVAALLMAPIFGLLTLLFFVVVVLGPTSSSASPTNGACLPSAPLSTGAGHLDEEQTLSAKAIVTVGQRLGVPARGWVIAVATALQESGLRPLPYGDRDSIGLFQQRAAWGSYQDRTGLATSSTMFYTGGQGGQRGLLDIPLWQFLPLSVAAQEVQVSAFPDAYAKWEPLAQAIVRKLSGETDTGCASAGTWISPVHPGDFVLTSGFGECGDLWEDCHTGLDFAAPQGTPAMAASDGVVTFAGTDGPYGNLVRVLHSGGVATWYAHLERINVEIGQAVRAGEVVGLIGQTGNVRGFHLHFEVRQAASKTQSGTAIDPHAWLQEHRALE